MGTRGVVRSGEGGVFGVSGLEAVALGERVSLGGGVGVVMRLEADLARVAFLGNPSGVLLGDAVESFGGPLSVEYAPGRVINGAGEPIDHKGPLNGARCMVRPRKTLMLTRGKERLLTGVLALDAMLSMERGGHTVLSGPHRSGKSALAAQIIKAQREQQIHCIYVCASSSPEPDIERLQEGMAHTMLIVADPALPLQRVFAPLLGLAMAEELRSQGKHAFLVLDDLKRCCAAYRDLLSLLGLAHVKAPVEPMLFSWLGSLWGVIGAHRNGGTLSLLSVITDEGLKIPMPGDLVQGFDSVVRLSAPSLGWKGPSIDISESQGGAVYYGVSPGLRRLRNQAMGALRSLQDSQRLSEKAKDRAQREALRQATFPGQQLKELFSVTTTQSLSQELQVILLFAILKRYAQRWAPSSMERFVQWVKGRVEGDPEGAQILASARTWKPYGERAPSKMEEFLLALPFPD